MILAGDVGGTKTRLGFFERQGERYQLRREQTYASREQPNLEAIISAFLAADRKAPRRACFGVAGPVKNGRCEATNLPWIVDAGHVARNLGIPEVSVINDLEATAYGIDVLQPQDLVTLAAGAPDAKGNRAVIAAGTGLGQAGLFWDGERHRPFACEGGHTDFAPRSDVEAELFTYLESRHGHVSYERILSGPGLYAVYEFLRGSGRGAEEGWLADEIRAGDPAAAISKAGLAGRSDLAGHALDLFVSIYGAEAGNLALKVMATGGVYVGGGIAPKILPRLQSPAFREAFVAKGRMRPLLEAMPLCVITDDRAALRGAARYAAEFPGQAVLRA